MKKLSLLVVAALLSVGCAHMQQQQQSISKAEIEQVKLTLKEIGNKIQEYYAKNGKLPEGRNYDFDVLEMKNPGTKTWCYSFDCEKNSTDSSTDSLYLLNCDVLAERATVNQTSFDILLSLTFVGQRVIEKELFLIKLQYKEILCYEEEGQKICDASGKMSGVPVDTSTAGYFVDIEPTECEKLQGHLISGEYDYCILEENF